MLYVHNRWLDNIETRSEVELVKFATDFNPLTEDEEFFNNLFQRKKLKERLEKY